MVDTIDRRQCTGCKLCGDVCPQSAIYFETDEYGFWYPKVNSRLCTNCGLCEKKCPALQPDFYRNKNNPRVYAAWSKNYEVRYESTSGGMFWEIATKFLEAGGVVAGCKWRNDWKSAQHIIAHNQDELLALRGSKYIQSDTQGIYKAVKEEIQKGKKVLFCGTPCQNAALQMYMDGQDENIYYLDFICRSINSPLAFQKYVSELESKYNSKVKLVHLKNKKKGWQSLASQILFDNGEESLLDRNDDPWIQGFLGYDLYTRNSCFECHYRSIPRKTSDITVGDFWGIKDEESYDMFRGISVVFVNTFKGQELLSCAKDNIFIKEKKIEDTISGNFSLLSNPKSSGKRQLFFDLIKHKSFTQCIYEITGFSNIKRENKNPYQHLQEDIDKYKNEGNIDKNQYLYLNFYSKNVIHKGKGKIIPFENSVLDLQNTSQIIIEGDSDFAICTNLLKNSKAETLIRMGKHSKWIIKHGGKLYYGTTIEIKENAILEMGYFTANTGSVIAVDKKISIGEDVMLSRNVFIYDSDFHQLLDESGNFYNYPKEIIIEDHVWISTNVNVQKGVRIGEGSIIANQTVVNRNIPKYSMVAGQSVGHVIRENVRWNRTPVKKYSADVKTKKIILFGYGVEGKRLYKNNKEKISFVIDNFVKEDGAISFNEFVMKYPQLNEREYLWVVAAPNYYDELYDQIKSYYPDMLVLSYTDI